MRHDEILGLLARLRYSIDDSPGLRLFGLELIFWTFVILLTIALVRFRPALLEKAEIRIRQISRHKRFWLAAFVLIVIVARVALLPWIPVPIPVVHDEFSFLLASDTFAHGRLTNPTNPMWVHFETFHVNMQPTYQSMYPPAQGLALAVGQKLTTVPWIGVLLTTALMCGAIYWMLLGWLPPQWAWLGGAFACVRFGIFSYWMNSYFGGSVAALGGALALGALARFRTAPKIQSALVFATGLLILATSRPLEGFVFSLPLILAVGFVLIKGVRNGTITWGATARIAFPTVALMIVGGAWMLYYNWRGTGNPLVMPYQVNFETYHISKPFIFLKSNPIPFYRHQSMRSFYVYHELPDLLSYRTDLAHHFELRADIYYAFFIWPFLLLIGPCAYVLWRSELRVVLVSMALLAADLFAQIWPPEAHYAAPATGAVFLVLLYSVRHFRSSQSNYAVWGSRALAIVLAAWMISPIAETLRDPYMVDPNIPKLVIAGQQVQPMPRQIQRARIQSQLETLSGKQLIIVHYPYHDVPSQDWIYNDADIDDAHVVWARDMGYLRNKELLNYFPDRRAWYIDRGDPVGFVLPYDRVTAPVQMAFDRAALAKDCPQFASKGQQLASAITKPASAHPAEIIAPRSR